MAYEIRENKTGKKIGDICFKTKTTATNYLINCMKANPDNYYIIKVISNKEKLANKKIQDFDCKYSDLCHAIENSESDIELLRIAKIFKKELKERRKEKSKINIYDNPNSVKKYVNKTTILNGCELNKKYDKIINKLIKYLL